MSTLQVPINTDSLFEPLLTSREAAPFLRVHYKTLETMARAGAVPATKKGKSWVFRLSRLSEWIDQELDSRAVRAKTDVGDHREFRGAYAVTSHSSQGLTAERVLVNADTGVHPDLLNSRFGYVSISRSSHEATIFTDDMTKLSPQLSTAVSKASALEIDQSQSINQGMAI